MRWTGTTVATIALGLWATPGCASSPAGAVGCGGLATPCADAGTPTDAHDTGPQRGAGDARVADAPFLPVDHDRRLATDAGGSGDGARPPEASDASSTLLPVNHCGVTGRDCRVELQDALRALCVSSGLAGDLGACDYDTCAPSHFDVDGNRANGCEYSCLWDPSGTNVELGGAVGCGRDDDCNGKVDDGLDFCTDTENCGACGVTCSLPNADTTSCKTTATDGKCDADNTACVVATCKPGFVDANGAPPDGCEYACVPSSGGVESCDGVDNDCDNLTDNVDDSLVDARLGVSCQGGNRGVCADPTSAGVMKCIDGIPSCCDTSSDNATATSNRYPATGARNNECAGFAGPFVIRPGDLSDTCNGLDDDCNGVVDDACP